MPGFLYFIQSDGRSGFAPGEGGSLPLRSRNCISHGCPVLPDGERPRGFTAFEDGMPPERLAVSSDSILWERWGSVAVNGEDCPVWVGVWPDWRPGPDDLAKELDDRIPTVPVRLRDGNLWQAPKVVDVDGTCLLPKIYKITDEGMTSEIPRESRQLAGMARRMLGALLVQAGIAEADGIEPLTEAELASLVLRTIGMVYRLGAPEVNLLELFEPATDDHQGSGGRWLAALCGIDLESEPGDGLLRVMQELSEGGRATGRSRAGEVA